MSRALCAPNQQTAKHEDSALENVKTIFKSVTFDRIMVMSLWPRFMPHCIRLALALLRIRAHSALCRLCRRIFVPYVND